MRVCDQCVVDFFEPEKKETLDSETERKMEEEELKKSPPEQHPEILKRQESFGLSGVREKIDIGKLDLKEETRKSRTSVRIEKKNTSLGLGKTKDNQRRVLPPVPTSRLKSLRSKKTSGQLMNQNDLGSPFIHNKNSKILMKRLSSAKRNRAGSNRSTRKSFRLNKTIGKKRASQSMSSITSTVELKDRSTTMSTSSSSSSSDDDDDRVISLLQVDNDDDWLVGTPKYGLRTEQLAEFATGMLGIPPKKSFFGDEVNIDALVDDTQQQELAAPVKVAAPVNMAVKKSSTVRNAPLPPSNRQRGRLRVHPEKLRQDKLRKLREDAMMGSLYNSLSSMGSMSNILSGRDRDTATNKSIPRKSSSSKPKRPAPKAPNWGLNKSKPKSRAPPPPLPLKASKSGKDLFSIAMMSH
jgi:hypothetical protein